MNKQFWKDFIAWTETATDEALADAKAEALRSLENTTDLDLHHEIRRMIRMIEEEMTIRKMGLPTAG